MTPGKAAWTNSEVKILDDGSLEIVGTGLIVPNPLMDMQFEDVNSPEFKGKLWQYLWREGLHQDPKSGRIRAILLNLTGQSVSAVMQALKEV